MKVKSKREVAQLCLTLSDPIGLEYDVRKQCCHGSINYENGENNFVVLAQYKDTL